MDPILQLMTAVVSSTASLALVFGGLAGWFVRRLDRRFDAIDRHFDAIDRRFEAIDRRFEAAAGDSRRQHEELKSDMQRQLEIARGERNRLAIQMDHLGGRLEGLGDQLGDVRQCVGRLEGAMFGAFEPQKPPGQTA